MEVNIEGDVVSGDNEAAASVTIKEGKINTVNREKIDHAGPIEIKNCLHNDNTSIDFESVSLEPIVKTADHKPSFPFKKGNEDDHTGRSQKIDNDMERQPNKRNTCPVCKCSNGPMFYLPKDRQKREAWKTFLGLESVSDHTQICARHFRSDDVKKSGKGRHHLSKNAVPSIKLPAEEKPTIRGHTNTSSKPKCLVPECCTTEQGNVSLHHFPRLYEQRRHWATVINLEKVPSRHNLICSTHFLATDFNTTGAVRSLKSQATPSVNLPNSANKSNKFQEDSEAITSEESAFGTAPSPSMEDRRHVLGDSLQTLAALVSAMGATVEPRNRLSDNKELSLDNQCSVQDSDEVCTATVSAPLHPHVENSVRELSSTPCQHDETRCDDEEDVGQSLEEVIRSVSANDSEEISNVIQKLPNDVKTNNRNIINPPTGSCNSAASSEASGCGVEKACLTETCTFDVFDLIRTDSQLKSFTGVNFSMLNCLLKLSQKLNDDKDPDVPLKHKIFLTLCKLRLNINYDSLSVLTGIPRPKCGSCFISTLQLLSVALKHVVCWPSKEEIAFNMPNLFENFRDTRVVLDCFEVSVTPPDCLKCRVRLHSLKKGVPTTKVLLGIAPTGLITFVSKNYGGLISAQQMFEESDLLSKLEPGVDAVMVDDESWIDEVCKKVGIKTYSLPPIWKEQLVSETDGQRIPEIADVRVLFRCILQKVKLFKILHCKMPWHMVSYFYEMCIITAALVNLGPSILTNDMFLTSKKIDL